MTKTRGCRIRKRSILNLHCSWNRVLIQISDLFRNRTSFCFPRWNPFLRKAFFFPLVAPSVIIDTAHVYWKHHNVQRTQLLQYLQKQRANQRIKLLPGDFAQLVGLHDHLTPTARRSLHYKVFFKSIFLLVIVMYHNCHHHHHHHYYHDDRDHLEDN